MRRHALAASAPSSVERRRFKLDKDATTISYGEHADAHARHVPPRAPMRRRAIRCWCWCAKGDYKLEQTGAGTRSACAAPAARASSSRRAAPPTRSSRAVRRLVGADDGAVLAHPLVGAVVGHRDGCGGRARRRSCAARRARSRAPCRRPRRASPRCRRRAPVHAQQLARARRRVRRADRASGRACDDAAQSIGWALKMNNLKIALSQLAPQIVHQALQIVGIMAYKNDSKFSLGRHYRDALSAALMISNDRIAAQERVDAARVSRTTEIAMTATATIRIESFYDELVEHGLHRSRRRAGRVRPRRRVRGRARALRRAGQRGSRKDDGAERLHFPPIVDRKMIEKTRLPGLVPAARGRRVQLLRQGARAHASSCRAVHAGEALERLLRA